MTADTPHTPKLNITWTLEHRDSLQIWANWFSVDYKNYFQVLLIQLQRGYVTAKLPSYTEYVQSRVTSFISEEEKPEFLAEDLQELYFKWISQEDLRLFDTWIQEINAALDAGNQETEIENMCDRFIDTFLPVGLYWNVPQRIQSILEQISWAQE